MSTQQQPQLPSAERLRQCRRAGFRSSITHLPVQKQQHLDNSYARQDANRERNVVNTRNQILGG